MIQLLFVLGLAATEAPPDRFRAEARGSFAVMDGRGVPDALRLGACFAVTPVRFGRLGLAVEGVALAGHSEREGWSWRAGGNAEVEWDLPDLASSLYVSTGPHWFTSRSSEDRAGLLWRGAVGARLALGGAWYGGIEPFAVEHLPKGDGPSSPLRSRWGIEVTFLVLGARF